MALTTFLGCAAGDQTLAERDPAAVATNPEWNLVFDLIDRECAPCHSGSVGPRLDSCEAIFASTPLIYQQVFELGAMPPGAWPRLSSEDRLLLERWFENGAVVPCQ